jgi:hypothetical protein
VQIELTEDDLFHIIFALEYFLEATAKRRNLVEPEVIPALEALYNKLCLPQSARLVRGELFQAMWPNGTGKDIKSAIPIEQAVDRAEQAYRNTAHLLAFKSDRPIS